MLLDSISCPTVPPAIGHAAGVCVCVCVQIHRVVFVFQMEKGVCVWVCMHTCYPWITKSETCVFVCVSGALRFRVFVVVWLSARALRMQGFFTETGQSCLFVSFREYHEWHHHTQGWDSSTLFCFIYCLAVFFFCHGFVWSSDDVTHHCPLIPALFSCFFAIL